MDPARTLATSEHEHGPPFLVFLIVNGDLTWRVPPALAPICLTLFSVFLSMATKAPKIHHSANFSQLPTSKDVLAEQPPKPDVTTGHPTPPAMS